MAGQQQYPFQGAAFERLEGSGCHLEIFFNVIFLYILLKIFFFHCS